MWGIKSMLVHGHIVELLRGIYFGGDLINKVKLNSGSAVADVEAPQPVICFYQGVKAPSSRFAEGPISTWAYKLESNFMPLQKRWFTVDELVFDNNYNGGNHGLVGLSVPRTKDNDDILRFGIKDANDLPVYLLYFINADNSVEAVGGNPTTSPPIFVLGVSILSRIPHFRKHINLASA